MKKITGIILCFILAASCAVTAFAGESNGTYGAYDRVFIVGVDGAGRFFRDANTPNFDRIFADGAVDYTARAETITVSAQNWGSVLCGVSFIRHGMTNDSIAKNTRNSDTKYPSVFKYVRDAYPDAELASYVHWNPINHGIIEDDIGVNKQSNGDDGALTDEICAYFDQGNSPKLFFCHFDSVDGVGHDEGSNSPNYISQIETVDGYIGRIYDKLVEKGLMENALFIVVSDHGHLISGGHWGLTARETNTTVAVKGKSVKAGADMDKDTRNRDVAAMVLYALGTERPGHMSARIPGNLFNGVDGETRPVKNELLDTVIAKITRVITVCTNWI
ncbi:MAG: alkaline phosphatase [Clostridia bacterium]|nr:alkaline phosphatase [Clostridia bacterium]